MSKKGTKALASATLMSIVLTTALSAGPVKASAGEVTRTSGLDKYATAAKVATANWTTSENVVLVSGAGYADAVSASALAKKLDCPILLTAVDSLSKDAEDAIAKLGAKNVYVIGGNASVSQAVRTTLKANYKLVELGGANRYETNVAVANKLVELGVSADKVMMVSGEGFSDALSVAPVAAAKGQILLLASDASVAFAKAHSSKVTVVGTKNVISDAVVASVNGTRIDGGSDRFDTNLKVLAAFKDSLKMDHLYVANASGNGYADALVASAIAGKNVAPLVLVADETASATSKALGFIKDNATKTTDLNVIGGTGVVAKGTETAINEIFNPTQTGEAAVDTVTATTATSFQVKFKSPIADTTKVSFDVSRAGTAVALTTTWDSTNTVATLAYSSNLPEDTYTVVVKNGDKELAKKDVAVTAQKIAKIEITSTTLGVTSPTTNTSGTAIGGNGYASYKVLDQYGNDITTSGIAQGITWTCGLGTVDGQNGLLTVTPFSGATNFLTQYTNCTINAVDQTTGITASANLTITATTGTLSEITLNKLYCSNDEKAIFSNGNTTDTFYLDYTAKDLSGNVTKNKKLIEAGLMHDSTGKITGLVSSNEKAVKVSYVADPSNSDNGLIKVEPQSGYTAVADQPIVITVFTSNGKSSTITLTLKKSSQLDKFTLAAPSQTVCAGDTGIIIPFTAVDQNGKAMTKYSEIKDAVTITSGFGNDLQLMANPDGTASLQLNVSDTAVSGGLSSQSYTIQAVTNNSGKFSSLNIAVQAKAVPNTLSVTTKAAVPNMESGAVQNLDFGANFSDLSMKDQYGRVFDMSNQDTTKDYYFVKATTNDTSVSITSDKAYNSMNIQLKAVGAPKSGSTTVTYSIYKHVVATNTDVAVSAVTPITQTYTVVDTTDIKDYTMDKIGDLYDVANASDAGIILPTAPATTGAVATVGTPKQTYIGAGNLSKFSKEANVYGLTSGGGKVALANTDILSVAVDNATDFTPDLRDNYYGTAMVGVYAKNTLNATKTTAAGNLTVTIKSADGLVHTVSTAIASKDETPISKSVGLNITKADSSDSDKDNIYTVPTYNNLSVVGNIVTMTSADFLAKIAAGSGSASNGFMSKYNANGTTGSSSAIYMYAVDQYGTKTAQFATWNLVVKDANQNVVTNRGLTLSAAGVLTSDGTALTTGDSVTVTGTTATGLVQSVSFKIQN